MVRSLISSSKKLLSREHTSILSAAMIIAVFTLMSAVLGLIRNRLLAAHFFGGMEGQLDVYFAAFLVPDTVFQLLVMGALSAAFIPVYSQKLKHDEKEANFVANATLNLVFVFLVIVTVVLIVFAQPVSRVIANFPEPQASLLVNLMRIMLLSQVFFGISNFLTGIIQSHRRFLVPALAPLVYNLAIIGGTLLSPWLGIYGPALGVVVGALCHMLVQIPLASKLGFKYRWIFAPGNPDVRTVGHLMPPRTFALALDQIERWVSFYFASLLTAGSLTMFNFARQLYSLPIGLFGVSLGQASLPAMSAEADEKELSAFRKTVQKAILQIFFFALPASAILLVLRIPVVRIVFGARQFPWSATVLTGRALAIFALSIAPQAAWHVLVRAFYALKNTKLPLALNLMTVILDVVLTVVFSRVFNLNIMGLALAITISNILEAILLLYFLENRVGRLDLYPSLIKLISLATVTALCLWVPMRLLDQFVFDTTRTVPLIILTLIAGASGLSVYLGLCYILKVPQLDSVVKLFDRWKSWRTVLFRSQEVVEPQPGNS